MMDRFEEARRDVCDHARKMWQARLVVASAGNVSRRAGDGYIAITPTSVEYEKMSPEQIVVIDLTTGRSIESTHAPSYELPMHLAVYRQRADIAAIVHTHSPFVTTLSVLRKPLPPVIDEMMLYFGGTVEVTDYAFTGTDDVGLNVLRALGDRAGVILANHGNVCVARTLDRALHTAITMESTAQVYVQALAAGNPTALPSSAIETGRRMYDERNRRQES